MQAAKESDEGRLSEVLHSGFPVFSAPPATVVAIDGYPGGELDPAQRGTGYIVVKIKGVEWVLQVNNQFAPWTLSPQSSPVSETSQVGMRKVPCSRKKRKGHPPPDTGDHTPYKYFLEGQGGIYLIMNMAARKTKTTKRPRPATAADDGCTSTDAPVNLTPATPPAASVVALLDEALADAALAGTPDVATPDTGLDVLHFFVFDPALDVPLLNPATDASTAPGAATNARVGFLRADPVYPTLTHQHNEADPAKLLGHSQSSSSPSWAGGGAVECGGLSGHAASACSSDAMSQASTTAGAAGAATRRADEEVDRLAALFPNLLRQDVHEGDLQPRQYCESW